MPALKTLAWQKRFCLFDANAIDNGEIIADIYIIGFQLNKYYADEK